MQLPSTREAVFVYIRGMCTLCLLPLRARREMQLFKY